MRNAASPLKPENKSSLVGQEERAIMSKSPYTFIGNRFCETFFLGAPVTLANSNTLGHIFVTFRTVLIIYREKKTLYLWLIFRHIFHFSLQRNFFQPTNCRYWQICEYGFIASIESLFRLFSFLMHESKWPEESEISTSLKPQKHKVRPEGFQFEKHGSRELKAAH